MPVVASPGEHDPAAVWVGAIDVTPADLASGIALDGGEPFAAARLLVRESGHVRGFTEVGISAGVVSGVDLTAALERVPPLVWAVAPVDLDEPVTVVVCTRDRPSDLGRCLTSLLALDRPAAEILVVDSASAAADTRDVVQSLNDARVRYLRLDRPGLSRARNAGVLAATHELLAFTDDDVVVDPGWLSALCTGFTRGDDVWCVTGMVASGQLETRAQRLMDRRLTWASNTAVTRFSLADPPAAYPLFPFQFGAYGTGASFASRRTALLELGGFDEALGVGTPTGGGEDVDWFTRVVLAGHTVVYQPDALVWHKHRHTDAELDEQLARYRVGLGALLAKLAGRPDARRAMLPLLVRGLVRTRELARQGGSGADPENTHHTGGVVRELRAMARGPLALRRSRRTGAAAPLLTTR